MCLRPSSLALALAISLVGASFAFQRPWREVPGVEYNDFPLPPDHQDKTEWQFARLMYPPSANFGYRRRRFGGDYRLGSSSWTIDYPRSDRHFSAAKAAILRATAAA